MNRLSRLVVCTTALLAYGGQVLAQSAPPPPIAIPVVDKSVPPPVGVPAKPDGSVHVRCDGQPPNLSVAQTLGYLLLITATAGVVGGMVGGPEVGDDGKKSKGEAGVDACTAALAAEKDETRRAQLVLARAVHQVEAKNFEAALADTRALPTISPTLSADRVFQQSLGVSAMNLEAAVLLRLGRPKDAEDAALRMAEAAPYDLTSQMQAAAFVGLTAEMTPAKQAFYARFARLHPLALNRRYETHLWAGDYKGAAADIESLTATLDAFLQDDKPTVPIFTARRAAAYMLAGDLDRSNSLAAEARSVIDVQLKSGEGLNDQPMISSAEELLDFQAVGRDLAEGKVKEARIAFAARSRWMAPPAPAVAVVTAKLRDGAAPAELTGALARSPEQLRADALTAKAGAMTESPKAIGVLYGMIRAPARAGDFNAVARPVWRTTKSRYLVKTKLDPKFRGEVIQVTGATPLVAGEALLLHAALIAKERGKSGFFLATGRKALDTAWVIFANPEDPGVPRGQFIEADPVIAALSVDMPRPQN